MGSSVEKTVSVSCIVPVYNAEKYLEEFLDSLVNQSFQDMEIICVDDGSADSSLRILNEYKGRREMIIIRNEDNVGAAESRNKGLRIAKGEYVIFLDCDDVMHSEMLECMYNECKKYKADICVGYVDIFSGSKYRNFGFQERNKEFILTYPVIDKPIEFQYIFQIIRNWPYDKMVRREILLNNKIKFQDLPRSNDIFFSYASALCSNKIIFVDKVLYYYRSKSDGSITSTWEGKKNFDCEAFDAIFDFLKEKGIYKLVWESFTAKVIEDIYTELPFFSERNRCETITKLKTNYFNKWEILEKYNQNMLTAVQKGMIDIIIGGREFVPYNSLLLSCSEKRLRQLVAGFCAQNRKIVWWGAGKTGLVFLAYFQKADLRIDYVVDNDLDKQGTEIAGYEIMDWDSVKDEADVILVTNYEWIGEIKKQTGESKEILNIISYLERQ